MNPKRRQRGSTLVVALIMLLVLALLIMSAIRSSNINMRIAGNTQIQAEATAAAQQAVEGVISTNFWAAPTSSVVNVDVNGDGTNDYRATVAVPTCTGSVPLTNENLNMTNPADVPCFSSSTAINTGLISASGVPVVGTQSWCFAQQWDVQAEAINAGVFGTGVDVTVDQGVAMRVPVGTLCD